MQHFNKDATARRLRAVRSRPFWCLQTETAFALLHGRNPDARRHCFLVTKGSMTYLSSVVYRYVMHHQRRGCAPRVMLPLLGVHPSYRAGRSSSHAVQGTLRSSPLHRVAPTTLNSGCQIHAEQKRDGGRCRPLRNHKEPGPTDPFEQEQVRRRAELREKIAPRRVPVSQVFRPT
jgi:hypothetical protein